MGGDTRTKRAVVPAFWRLPRKRYQFAVTTSLGPHPKAESYSLAVLLRDVLGYVRTLREATFVLNSRQIRVDGVVRTDPGFPIGIIDTLTVEALEKTMRVVPSSGRLSLLDVPSGESNLKLCQIIAKVTQKGGRIQYGLHDGRTLIAAQGSAYSPLDTLLIEVPGAKVLNSVRFEKGALAMVVRGSRSGKIGEILRLTDGGISKPRTSEVLIEGTPTELPATHLMPVGKQRELVRLR